MEKSKIKTVVIPAAGLGSRLGDFTKQYSKGMCTLGPKPIIGHIIEKFSKNDNIIILLGYMGDLLREAVQACYPDMNITFIDVDNFSGPGSGLGYSLSCAEDLLQKPFIFWALDTILPDFDVNGVRYNENWMVNATCDDALFCNYRHVKVADGMVVDMLPKICSIQRNVYSYTGVAFIKDYEFFWETAHKMHDTFILEGESLCLKNMPTPVESIMVSDWIDAGNRQILERAKKAYNEGMDETVLEKPDEAIWFIGDHVTKFHVDEKFIADRVTRYNSMLCDRQLANGISLPKLTSHTKHTYTYKRAPGVIASKIVTPPMLQDILEKYCTYDAEQITEEEARDIYEDFYKVKTLKRIKKYCTENNDIDDDVTINGVRCVSAYDIIDNVDWGKLSKNGLFTKNFHGDFHLENILVDDGKYVMLDWRQNFGHTMVGDAYYDIAKMWHSLIVNHAMVKADLFDADVTSHNNIRIDIHRTLIDTQCEDVLKEWVARNFDLKQAQFMTALIFLNIAACHTYPYSRFLFYLGKFMMNKFIAENPEYLEDNPTVSINTIQ